MLFRSAKGPLRIWIPQGQEGETGRRGPPSDTGGRVWDTSEVLFRQVEGDALFDQPREDAMT